MSNTVYFYKDRPLFGMDLSVDCVQVMQVEQTPKGPIIVGYGNQSFDPSAIKNGVILDPISIAKAVDVLFERNLQGHISTRRVAVAIPSSRTFSRAISLPLLSEKELDEAVRMEAEQYIPTPIDELYLDYSIMRRTEKEIELFAVASPRQLVDSYVSLLHLLGLEPVAIETSIDAVTRLFVQSDYNHVPTVLIDFGPLSADITIVDETIIATGTVGGGGENFTTRISNQLGVTRQEAHIIKTKYGLNFSKKQQEISKALDPLLDQLVKEIRRMIRYYQERYGAEHQISQIVLMGSGANVPGLSDRMTDILRLPVRSSSPWRHFGTDNGVTTPQTEQHADFLVAGGLALLQSKEVSL